MPATLDARKPVLPNARTGAGELAAGMLSGTAVCAIHATRHASRNCQIKADAKCMQSSNAVKTMAAQRFKKERKRG